jgi:hypothetical protein
MGENRGNTGSSAGDLFPARYGGSRGNEEAEEIRRLLASGGYGARRRNWVKSSFAVGFNQRN